MKLDPHQIGLRVQDIQTGLQDIELRGVATGLMDDTRLVGMAARLAIHIRGAEIIEDYDRLTVVASELGIDSLILPNVLHALQEVEFATLEGKPPDLKVYEDVPYFKDIYEELGTLWESRAPSELQQASVEILQDLAMSPTSEEALRKDYPLEELPWSLIKDIGGAGGYIKTYQSSIDNADVVYSPLFWEENPKAMLDLLKTFPAKEIADAIKEVQLYQGYPIPNLREGETSRKDQIILEAMQRGLLPTPAVESFRGKRYFAFTPYAGGVSLAPEEKAILNKARIILSCVRYGEHFGTITKIRDPEAILHALQTRGRIGPHTEIGKQYALLAVRGIGRIVRDTQISSRYWLEIIDTPENRKAFVLAKDILVVGEAITDRGLDDRARAMVFQSGRLQEPLTTIAEARRQPSLSDESICRLLDRITDTVRIGAL